MPSYLESYKKSGYIYVSSFDGYDGCLKIGLTTTCQVKRVEQMNSSSYTLGRFTLIASFRTANVHDVERMIHNDLMEYGMGKEFFRISEEKAIKSIEKFLISENLSGSGALVKSCIHFIDFDKSKLNLMLDSPLCVIQYNIPAFYVLPVDDMSRLLSIEKQFNEMISGKKLPF